MSERPHGCVRDGFRTDLYASIARATAQHKLDYVPHR